MPMHDWTRVEDGIYHAFHAGWINSISAALNSGLLPEDFYALPERVAAGYRPDVLALQIDTPDDLDSGGGTAVALQTRPKSTIFVETEGELYRRKKSSVAIRQVSGDRMVALIELVSPGNKSSRHAIRTFVEKASDFLERRIHLLIVDPFAPGPRDPEGIHGLIWSEIADDSFHLPPNKPLTVVAYECDLLTRAYLEPLAVGDPLPDMPLVLEPDGCVMVPLEATYNTAYAVQPRRWRNVLDAK